MIPGGGGAYVVDDTIDAFDLIDDSVGESVGRLGSESIFVEKASNDDDPSLFLTFRYMEPICALFRMRPRPTCDVPNCFL